MGNANPRHRMLATLFDFAIVFAFSILIMGNAILSAIDTIIHATKLNIFSLFFNSLITGGLILVFLCLYFLVIPVYWKGQTFGKRFFKIKIVKQDGSDVNFQTLFMREVIGRIFILLLSFGFSTIVNCVMLCASKQHLAFHDVLTSTKVIDVE